MKTRPLTLIVAIVLLMLLGVFGIFSLFIPNGPPLVIQLYGFIVGAVGGLIAVVGLWLLKRWGLWLTIGISAASILVSVPGLVGAPTIGKVVAAAIIVAYALILVLVTRPASRQAFAPVRARTMAA